MHFKSIFFVSAFFAILFSPLITAEKAHAVDTSKLVCHQHIAIIERQNRIPVQLLEAIALNESGHWDPATKRRVAWPWTVMAEGRGRYFNSKAEAVAEVKALQARGIRNIDVGCMQINMHYHGHAFNSVEEAMDPRRNVQYAASFLLDLKERHNTWTTAVGNYHSATPHLHARYRDRVLNTWRQNRQQYASEQRSVSAEQRQALLQQRQQMLESRRTSGRLNVASFDNTRNVRVIPY